MAENPFTSFAWWKGTDTPRWALVVGGAIAIVTPLLGSYIITNWSRAHDYQANQVHQMIDSMVQFQTFAAAFASEMAETRSVSANTRSRLIENLNEQYARIRQIEEFVDDASRREAEAYRATIAAMIEVVQRTDDFMSMGEFWTAASDLTVARNRLSPLLRRQV